MTRLSRPCYDKPHRCPGWAGGGWKSASDRHPCANGSICTRVPDTVPHWTDESWDEFWSSLGYPATDKWRFGRCMGGLTDRSQSRSESCGVITIPWALRKLDPRWWLIYWYQLQNWLYFRRNR